MSQCTKHSTPRRRETKVLGLFKHKQPRNNHKQTHTPQAAATHSQITFAATRHCCLIVCASERDTRRCIEKQPSRQKVTRDDLFACEAHNSAHTGTGTLAISPINAPMHGKHNECMEYAHVHQYTEFGGKQRSESRFVTPNSVLLLAHAR